MIHFLFLPDLIKKERSFLLKHHSLIVYSVIGVCLFLFNYFLTYTPVNILGYATNINSQDLLLYTNQTRINHNLPDLKYSEVLSKAAAKKAEHMFEENYWAHVSPTGVEPWYFIKEAGYSYLYAGENLAIDFSDSSEVVDAWFNSPSHKENLLSSNYTDIGFAVINGELNGRKTTLVVQMFGTPLDASMALDSNEDVVTPNEAPAVVASVPAYYPNTGAVLNASTVFNASKYIALILGGFLILLFAIDGYYIRVNDVNRITGHTLFHILLLGFALISIWYTNVGLIL